jgi:hypothetical protein
VAAKNESEARRQNQNLAEHRPWWPLLLAEKIKGGSTLLSYTGARGTTRYLDSPADRGSGAQNRTQRGESKLKRSAVKKLSKGQQRLQQENPEADRDEN